MKVRQILMARFSMARLDWFCFVSGMVRWVIYWWWWKKKKNHIIKWKSI